jgi:hypothetical protein
MLCNGLIGLAFLPRATRELTAIRNERDGTIASA